MHDPLHVFLRFDRPVDFEVKARAPLFPVLYKKPAGTSSDPNLVGPHVASGSMEMRNLGDPTGTPDSTLSLPPGIFLLTSLLLLSSLPPSSVPSLDSLRLLHGQLSSIASRALSGSPTTDAILLRFQIPITGAWYRCAVCARSFDLCSDCHDTIEHDKDHVFVVFKSDVDMQTFRSVPRHGLSTGHRPRPRPSLSWSDAIVLLFLY